MTRKKQVGPRCVPPPGAAPACRFDEIATAGSTVPEATRTNDLLAMSRAIEMEPIAWRKKVLREQYAVALAKGAK